MNIMSDITADAQDAFNALVDQYGMDTAINGLTSLAIDQDALHSMAAEYLRSHYI
jgi:hypothetical protein